MRWHIGDLSLEGVKKPVCTAIVIVVMKQELF